MFTLCRLCAKYTPPTRLKTEVLELEPKLTVCCGWQPSVNELHMPRKVCNSCVDDVQRSWNLIEQIRGAETKLDKLLREHLQLNLNESDDQQNMEVKMEDDVEIIDTKFDEDADYFDDDDGDKGVYGNCNEDSDTGANDDVFGESINYLNGQNSNSNKGKKPQKSVKDKTNKNQNQNQTNRMKNDTFFATLIPEDFLENGQISLDGVKKLAKLYSDMKTISWSECQYNCTKCHQTLKGANSLYTHMRSIHCDDPKKSIKISCFYCNFKTRREATLNRHMFAEHFEHLKFRCTYCTKYYWNTIELTHHRNAHNDVEYKCERCEQIFHNRDTMYSHCVLQHSKRGRKNPDEEYICDLCSKKFKTKAGVRAHLFVHMKKFDHICEICGWKFNSKGNLNGHLASTHSTERPFKCDQCHKRFKTKHHMNNHAVIHNNIYKHECSVCGRKFRRPYTLGVHMRKHTEEVPYCCRFCGKKFRHNITLQTHERSHTNTKPYGCTHCEYRSTSKGNLNKHMMRAHSIDFRNHIVFKDG